MSSHLSSERLPRVWLCVWTHSKKLGIDPGPTPDKTPLSYQFSCFPFAQTHRRFSPSHEWLFEFNAITTLRLPSMSPTSLVILLMGLSSLSRETSAPPDPEFMCQIRAHLLKPALLHALQAHTLANVAGCICRARGGPDVLPHEHVAIVRAIARCTSYLAEDMDRDREHRGSRSSGSHGSSSTGGESGSSSGSSKGGSLIFHSPRWLGGSMDDDVGFAYTASAALPPALHGASEPWQLRSARLPAQDVWRLSGNTLLHTAQADRPTLAVHLGGLDGHHESSSDGSDSSSSSHSHSSLNGHSSNDHSLNGHSGNDNTEPHNSSVGDAFKVSRTYSEVGGSSRSSASLDQQQQQQQQLSPKELTNLCWAACTLAAQTRQYGMVRDGPRLLQRFSTHFKQHSTVYSTPDLLQLLRSYASLPNILPDATWLHLHEARAVQLYEAGRVNPPQLVLFHHLYGALQYAAYDLPDASPEEDDRFQISQAQLGRRVSHSAAMGIKYANAVAARQDDIASFARYSKVKFARN